MTDNELKTTPMKAPASERRDDDEIDLLELLGTLMAQRVLIGAIVGVALVLALFYVTIAQPIYRADVLIQVEEKQGGIPGLDEMSELFSAETSATTEIEVYKSRSVIGRAVDELRLTIKAQPNYFPVIGRAIARRFSPEQPGDVASAFLGLRKFAWGGESIEVLGMEEDGRSRPEPWSLIAGDAGQYSVYYNDELVMDGRVGELSGAADGSLRLYVSELVAAPGTEFLLDKAPRLAVIKSLQSQINVSERGKRSGVLVATLDSADPAWAVEVLQQVSDQYVLQNVKRMSAEAAKSLEFLRAQLPDVKSELEQAEDRLNQFRMSSRSVDISMETEALLQQIVEIENEISLLNLKQIELERQFKPQHPIFETLRQQQEQLQAKKRRFESEVDGLPDTQQQMLRLMRDVEVKTEIYTQLLNKAQELDVVRAGTVGNVRILDDAAVDVRHPVKPKKALMIALAAVLGLVLGVIAALVRVALNRGVESPEQIEDLGIPVYATIPLSDEQDRRGEALGLLSEVYPEDLAVESLRGLRTSIHFALVGAQTQSLLVTGPSPNVGKTFVSSNLAALLASGGDRVCLVDGDMRRGTMHQYFDLAVEGGLSDVLSGQKTLDQVLKNGGDSGNLTVITRGKAPPNPSELLMSQQFTDMMRELNERFDVVIIDTPPALAVTDAAIVGHHVAATLLIARQRQNPVAEIRYACNRLEQNGVSVKGAVLNAVQRNAGAYGYGYGNYAYYQYDYKTAD